MAHKSEQAADVVSITSKTNDETRIAGENWERYSRNRDAKGGHIDWVKIAKKCDDFYRGEQWDLADVQELDRTGRPHLTINLILSTVNTVLGEQSTKRAEVQFKPKGNGTQETAEALTKVFMHISDNNNLDWVESQVFADGIIQDRGYFDVRLDFSDSVHGEVRIRAMDPLEVVLDADAKEYDPDTWTEVTVTRWISLDEAEAIYGKPVRQKLQLLVNGSNHFGPDSMEVVDNRFADTWEGLGYATASTDGSRQPDIKSIRIIERQHRKLTMVPHFVDIRTGDMRVIPDNWPEEKVAAFQERFGLGVVKKLQRKIRWTASADHVLLFDDWSPYERFTIVPYFPYFRRGKPMGMVRNLLSPQEQYNKVSSQELHIVNTTANSGWMVQNGSLSNGMTPEELEKKGAKTGLILEYNQGFEIPQKIQPNPIPQGLDRIGLKSAQNIKEISGVSDALLGMDGAEVSGVAIQAKQARGQVQIQVPLDNLTKTRHFLARAVLGLVQRFYNEERLIPVINEAVPGKPREHMGVNQPDPNTGEIVNNLMLGEYDVVISSMPARDIFDDTQFAEALELRNAGIMVPDDIIIDYSNLNRKTELATRIRQQMGLDQSPEQQQLAMLTAQIEMKATELNLNKLEAEVEKLRVEAGLIEAEIQEKVQGADSPEAQRELRKLQFELDRKREEYENRQMLTKMQGEAKTLAAKIVADGSMQEAKIKAQTDRYKADKAAAAARSRAANSSTSNTKR